jgi:hypothetical protein
LERFLVIFWQFLAYKSFETHTNQLKIFIFGAIFGHFLAIFGVFSTFWGQFILRLQNHKRA